MFNSKYLFLIISLFVTTALFQNCSAVHEGSGDLGSNQSVFGIDMASVTPKFEATLKPVLRSNCAGCHGVNQSPLFAVDQSDLALGQISNFSLINLNNPADSRFVVKLKGGHSGFGATEALQIQTAIQNFANLLNPGSVDAIAPVISITTPSAGATLSGNYIASATASDNVAVVGVQFYIDGNAYGPEMKSSPFFTTINTLTLANGSHTISAKARDAAGNVTTASPLNVTVSNSVADTIAPIVNVTSPTANASVLGTVTITANATDALGVTGVQFYIDGVALGAQDTAAPYSVSLNTTLYANGSHTISANARDAAGNVGTSATMTITINNPAAAPTYTWIATNILTPKCVSCHGASGASAGRGFNSYSRTMASVQAGNASASILYTTVTTGKMSKSPYPILNTNERNAIRDWINAGALNN